MDMSGINKMRHIDKYKQLNPNDKLIQRESPLKVKHRRRIIAKLLAKRYRVEDIYKYLKKYAPNINGEKKKGYYSCSGRSIRDDIKTIKVERKKWYMQHVDDYANNLSGTLAAVDQMIKEVHDLNALHRNIFKNGRLKKRIKLPLGYYDKLEKVSSLIDLEKFRASISGLLVKNKINIDNLNINNNNEININNVQERLNKLNHYVEQQKKVIDVEKVK